MLARLPSLPRLCIPAGDEQPDLVESGESDAKRPRSELFTPRSQLDYENGSEQTRTDQPPELPVDHDALIGIRAMSYGRIVSESSTPVELPAARTKLLELFGGP